jgi:hypothetical protein
MDDITAQTSIAVATELAAACAAHDELVLLRIVNDMLTTTPAVQGKIQKLSISKSILDSIDETPWQAGLRMAREFRSAIGIPAAPVDDIVLCHLLGVTNKQLFEDIHLGLPFGLAIRKPGKKGGIFFGFRDQPHYARRFDAARLVAASSCESRQRGGGAVPAIRPRWFCR